MGMYVNPGNVSFTRIAGPKYVDKTGLISLMNERIGKDNSLVCISRPRRFGKTYAAKMLTAYYDRSCDSHELFKDKKIADAKDFEKYLNQFNVICLDITGFISAAKDSGVSLREVPGMVKKALWKDLVESGFVPKEGDTLNDFLLRCAESEGGKPFIFIIDEWDAMIREAMDDEVAQTAYLNLLEDGSKTRTLPRKRLLQRI